MYDFIKYERKKSENGEFIDFNQNHYDQKKKNFLGETADFEKISATIKSSWKKLGSVVSTDSLACQIGAMPENFNLAMPGAKPKFGCFQNYKFV